mmetsp:Transcript_4337/g.8694  ORF Transcript_4337/g.8694 Transcript_4337/m.8694 type:complete len:216 (+) Transcript_4337:93-740(+)
MRMLVHISLSRARAPPLQIDEFKQISLTRQCKQAWAYAQSGETDDIVGREARAMDLYDYAAEKSAIARSDIGNMAHKSALSDLRHQTYELFPTGAHMMLGPLEASLLGILVGVSGASRVLEIGTFTGYSAMSMLEALPRDSGYIKSIDKDPSHDLNKGATRWLLRTFLGIHRGTKWSWSSAMRWRFWTNCLTMTLTTLCLSTPTRKCIWSTTRQY